MDTLVSLVREYLERVSPKGPGWGTCYMCAKAGGEHLKSCLIGRMAREVEKEEELQKTLRIWRTFLHRSGQGR